MIKDGKYFRDLFDMPEYQQMRLNNLNLTGLICDFRVDASSLLAGLYLYDFGKSDDKELFINRIGEDITEYYTCTFVTDTKIDFTDFEECYENGKKLYKIGKKDIQLSHIWITNEDQLVLYDDSEGLSEDDTYCIIGDTEEEKYFIHNPTEFTNKFFEMLKLHRNLKSKK